MALFGAKRGKKDNNNNNNNNNNNSQSGSFSPPSSQDQFGKTANQSSPVINNNASMGNSQGSSNGGGIPSSGAGSRYLPSEPSQSFQSQLQPLSVSQVSILPPLQSTSPTSPSSQSPSPTPSPSNSSVLYPWALRQLQLLPAALLPPPDPLFLASPVWGPPSASPFPRYGHSVNPVASSPSGDLYIFGGLVANSVKNDLYVMGCAPIGTNDSSGIGSNGGALGVGLVETRGEVPGPRVGHASVGVGNVLIVWGGDTKSRPEDKQDDGLYLLNLSTREWTRVTTIGSVPEGRYGHASAMVGSKFFVFGGQKDDGEFMNDLVWFDLQNLKIGQPKWTFVDYEINALTPPKRTGHTTVTHGDCIYVFGGTDGQYHYNDTWCYDTNTQLWVELSCIGYIPVPREGHAATLVDDVMYVFGGRGVDGKDLEDLAAFKITNQRWFMFQNMGPAPSGRSGHAMATFQNKVYVLGGESYTSQKPDDPAFVHVLDTSKIKYPADNPRQAQAPISRNPSIPVINAITPPLSDYRSIPEDHDARRITSPLREIDELDNSGGIQSLVPVVSSQSSSSPLIPGSGIKSLNTGRTTSPPPLRPPRPGDEADSRFDLKDGDQVSNLSRTIPPTLVIGQNLVPPGSGQEKKEWYSGAPNGTMSNPVVDGHRLDGELSDIPANGVTDGISQSQEEDMAALKSREVWMRAALALATRQGFVAGEQDTHRVKGAQVFKDDDAQDIMDALIRVKQELAQAKMALSDQAHAVDDRVENSSRARTAALQEASYYRAKLAAVETGSVEDIAKIDRDRNHRLEKKLAESISIRLGLERQVSQLEQERDHNLDARASVGERHDLAINRAEAAETSYSRLLIEYADLQQRSNEQESVTQDHLHQIVSLTSSTQQLVAENRSLTSHSNLLETSSDQYVRTLEETRLALAAANFRNDEIHSVWEANQSDMLHHQTRVEQLTSELEAKHLETDSLLARATDLERVLKATRDEHEVTKILAGGGLAELVAAHRDTRMEGKEVPDETLEKRTALELEVVSVNKLFQESRVKRESLSLQLGSSRMKEVESQTQISQLRSELASLRTQHSLLLTDVGRVQLSASAREGELVEGRRARELAEVRANLLQSLMADHGLAVAEGGSTVRDASANQSEGLFRQRIEILEGQLDQKNRALSDLGVAHESSQREVLEGDERLQELDRRQQASDEQVEQLHAQISSLRTSPEDPVNAHRATKAEEELEALNGRHRHLEQTHMKAVQYVKGTEKMLRRMKEELNRYKERNEELEIEAQTRNDQTLPDSNEEKEGLRNRIHDLDKSSSLAIAEKEDLVLKLTSLQSDYERKLHDHEVDTTLRVEELHSAESKAKLLKLENTQLEKRCQTAEEKISVLLDHFENFNEEVPNRDEEIHEGPPFTPIHEDSSNVSHPLHRWTQESGVSEPFSDEESAYSGTTPRS